jgi:hypothetical protein
VRPTDPGCKFVPSCSMPSLWSSCLSTPSRAGPVAPDRLTSLVMERLLELAEGSGLHAHIAMFRGEQINRTEDRAVLHVPHLRRLREVAALEAQAVSP